MKTLETYTVNFPTWALSALINSDISALSDKEVEQVEAFENEFYEVAQSDVMKHLKTTKTIGFCIYTYPENEEHFFCPNPEFGLATDCVELTVSILV